MAVKLGGRVKGMHLLTFPWDFWLDIIAHWAYIFLLLWWWYSGALLWASRIKWKLLESSETTNFVYNKDFNTFMLWEKQVLWVFRKIGELFFKSMGIKACMLEMGFSCTKIQCPHVTCTIRTPGPCTSKALCSGCLL